ncbi:hypothetical protein BDR04DRAFT_20163 [Suillus decipiens]|nr:hypothetical protein BDR04DRAFT_20163 [Suillus decipiens]
MYHSRLACIISFPCVQFCEGDVVVHRCHVSPFAQFTSCEEVRASTQNKPKRRALFSGRASSWRRHASKFFQGDIHHCDICIGCTTAIKPLCIPYTSVLLWMIYPLHPICWLMHPGWEAAPP